MRILYGITLLLLCGTTAAADMILTGGRIWTGDPPAGTPDRLEATALAIESGRIIAVGDDATITALADADTQRIDLGGRRVVPGINDAHTHVGSGLPGTRLDLPFPEPSFEQIVSALRAQTSSGDGWITGEIGGSAFADPRLRRARLDALHPTRPVSLGSWTGHGAVINSAAQRALSIDPRAPVAGGWYGRDAAGAFDGRLFEYARWRATRLRDQGDGEATVAAIRGYAQQALALGITSIQNMPTGETPERFLAAWRKAGAPLRLRLIRTSTPASLDEPVAGSGLPALDPAMPRVVVSGTKWILDGTPIEQGAAMRRPYPGTAQGGQLNFSRGEIETLLREALARRDQVLLHSSGDASAAAVFDAMAAIGPATDWPARRVRIEHGDGLSPDLLQRAATLGVVVVQNPSHLMVANPVVIALTRDRGMQPLSTLLAHGIPLALGSDGPMHPWLNLMWATAPGMRPDEALSREQALRAYTSGSAYAEFAESDKGRLATGYLADFAVLSQDVLAVPAEALPATRSVMTVIDGAIAWRDPAF